MKSSSKFALSIHPRFLYDLPGNGENICNCDGGIVLLGKVDELIIGRDKMHFMDYYLEQFLERHKIIRYICLTIFAVLGVLLMIGIFSWDSLLGWIITKEKSDLNLFIFWAVFGVIMLIASIALAIFLGKKRK